MKALTILLLLVIASVPEISVAQGASGFHWDWSDAQFLSARRGEILKSSEISPAQRTVLIDVLANELHDVPHPMERAAEARVKLVDLNGDGVPEVLAQSTDDFTCGATGNCFFWVLQKSASGYKVILRQIGVQMFTIQLTRTHGFVDLVLGRHESATEQKLFLYRFRRGQYRLAACYIADWEYLDSKGKIHDAKQPRITRCAR